MFTLKILGCPRPRLGCTLQSLGQSLVRVKLSGASTHQGPIKCISNFRYVDPFRGYLRWNGFTILDILSHSEDIRDQIRMLCKIGPNFARFSPAEFLREGHWIFGKVEADTDHVVKFRSDRPTEHGYPVAN